MQAGITVLFMCSSIQNVNCFELLHHPLYKSGTIAPPCVQTDYCGHFAEQLTVVCRLCSTSHRIW